MARLSIWNSGTKGADYKFTDRTISEYFGVSGTALYIHRYEGVYDQDAADGSTMDGGYGAIQDVVFLENRDRKYSEEVFEMRGLYQLSDAEFDLRQFGFLQMADTVFIEVHFNDMVALLGRKILQGDVIELPHRRDDATLGGGAINRFYVVEDANYAAEGYSTTWYPHIWRFKVVPMSAGPEYQDILDKEAKDPFGFPSGETLGDLLSTIGSELELNEKIVEQAKVSVLWRNFETQHFYVVPGDELTDQQPWIFAGDGIPPNGAALLTPDQRGNRFPEGAAIDDYYLRTDYDPPTLFRKTERGWKIQEVNYRHQERQMAHRLLVDFVNNNKTSEIDGEIVQQKQGLSKVMRPKADF